MNLAPFEVSAEDAREVFKRIDRNGNGKISRDETLKNLEYFYYSGDLDARGN
jgi:Ca2+-binding EF-hand superfamily protein